MQKQTQLSEMPVAVLIITIVVMLGSLMGVLYYFAANVAEFNPSIMVAPVEKEVVIKTNKLEYEQGEGVKITAKNSLLSNYELHWPYFEIEKKENNQWKKIIIDNCDCLNVKCKIDSSIKILNKEEVFEWEWNLQDVKCNEENEQENSISNANTGIYRVKIIGRIASHTHWSLDYFISNEFTIKEKSAIDPRCGQKVSIAGVCEGKLIDDIGYEFNSKIEKCNEKVVGGNGCKVETPFNSLEECQKTCEKSADFYSCSQDSDCISVKAGCCGCTAGGRAVAINKSYKNSWRGNCKEEMPVMCPMVMSDDPSCFAEPRCVKNKCVLKQDEDVCNIGKGDGDFGGIEGIFTEDSSNYSEMKSSCEQKTECKWQGLGGKIVSHYACCPKDLGLMMGEDGKTQKAYKRCGLRID